MEKKGTKPHAKQLEWSFKISCVRLFIFLFFRLVNIANSLHACSRVRYENFHLNTSHLCACAVHCAIQIYVYARSHTFQLIRQYVFSLCRTHYIYYAIHANMKHLRRFSAIILEYNILWIYFITIHVMMPLSLHQCLACLAWSAAFYCRHCECIATVYTYIV